jgi:Flp pilus assembly protein TadB
MSDWVAYLLMGIALVAPLALIVQLFRVAARRLSGRRGRYDSLFEGLGRAATMSSHLKAGTPHPDDLAVPTTELAPPGRRPRSRGHG